MAGEKVTVQQRDPYGPPLATAHTPEKLLIDAERLRTEVSIAVRHVIATALRAAAQALD